MQIKFLVLALFFNNLVVNGISIESGSGKSTPSAKYWKVGLEHKQKNYLMEVPHKDPSKYYRVAVVGDSISDDDFNPFEKAA